MVCVVSLVTRWFSVGFDGSVDLGWLIGRWIGLFDLCLRWLFEAVVFLWVVFEVWGGISCVNWVDLL